MGSPLGPDPGQPAFLRIPSNRTYCGEAGTNANDAT
jgi:hypothetical protein